MVMSAPLPLVSVSPVPPVIVPPLETIDTPALPRWIAHSRPATPRLDPVCWNKKGDWVEKKCGPLAWPPGPAAVASNP